jgi:hypothetical protein
MLKNTLGLAPTPSEIGLPLLFARGPILSLAVAYIRSLQFSMEPFVTDPHSAPPNRISLRDDS